MISEEPEINIEELKKRIRAEVGARRDLPGAGVSSEPTNPPLNGETSYSEALQFYLGEKARRGTMDQLTEILQEARAKTEVSRRIPKVFRRLFRKQGGFNKMILESFQVVLRSLQNLRSENSDMRAYLEAQYYWMRDFAERRCEDRRSLGALKTALSKEREIAVRERVRSARQLEDAFKTNALVHFLLREIDIMHARQAALSKDLKTQSDALEAATQQDGSRDGDTARRKGFDAFYVAFENRFRGARPEIKKRLEVYLPYLAKLSRLKKDIRVLDIGSGRGEWLELLGEKGYAKSEGIDINMAMVAVCRKRKLPVSMGDGIEHLIKAPNGSLDIVTAFQVIEHLPFNRLMQLFTEAQRALKRGGLLIVETPNPDNLIVAAKNFYTDPTHRNPLPSVLISFMAEYAGFTRVEVLNQHPFSPGMRLKGPDPIAERLNEILYSEQDYAVIGVKP